MMTLLFPIVRTLYTPCIHTRMLFFTFLHLALCSRNNKPPHRYTEPPDQPSAPSLAISFCTSSVGLRPYDCWTVGRAVLSIRLKRLKPLGPPSLGAHQDQYYL